MDDGDIDDILNSPPAKRKENTKPLDGTAELRRSTKSVTFMDQDDEDGFERKETPIVSGNLKKQDSEKSVKARRKDDFDEDTPPLGGLDTPRSEESSVDFPDDSPRKTSGSGGGSSGSGSTGRGSLTVKAPKMGFDMFITSSTVSEELAPKAKKKDFDSFLGGLNASTYSAPKADTDDPLNNSGSASAYQPWAPSKSRPATGDATLDLDSVFQSVDLTLKKRPVTAPVPTAAAEVKSADAVVEKPAKKTLQRLLADDDELFGTAPVRTNRKTQQREAPLSVTIDEAPRAQPPLPLVATAVVAPTAADTFKQDEDAVEMAPRQTSMQSPQAPAVAKEDFADTVYRPPTGRRARGVENPTIGLFDNGKPDDSFLSSQNIPLSKEMRSELETEIKKLRREKDELQQQIEQLQRKAKEEQSRAEESFKRQLADQEEITGRREEMLRKENEQLSQKYSDTQRQMDQERVNLRSEFNRQMDELAQEKRRELDKLREQHRNDIEALRSAAPHAGALSNLVDRLGHLSEKLGTLSDRESSFRQKDEVYREAEVKDQKVMNEIVHSLKIRVDESARTERWLNDLATQLIEERRSLAAERAELRVLKLTEGSRKSDFESERMALTDERARLQEMEARLRHSRTEVLRQRSDLETLAEEIKLKEAKLIDGQRSLEERLEMVSRREKSLRDHQAKIDAAAVEQAERTRRSEGIQGQLSELRTKEREVSQAMIQLAEERASLDKRAGSLLCANCRTPVRDSHATLYAGGYAGGQLRPASSMEFAFARSRNWDEIDDEKLYLESLNHAPYG